MAGEARRFLENPRHLLDRLSAQSSSPALVVIDQFEEVFTLCGDEDARRAFADNLLELTRSPDATHRVVLTLRIDFRDSIPRLPHLAAVFGEAEVLVTPLTAAELRDAIERPAERIGLKFEEGLIDKLVEDVVGEPAGLPLLQFTLLKLWEARDHNRVTWDAYRKLGGGRQSLANSADQVWKDLGLKENQDAGRLILLEMVRPTEGREFTSSRVRRQRLYNIGVPGERISLVLGRLVDARLLRVTPGETEDQDRIEVAHEALVRNWPELIRWLDEERGRLKELLGLTRDAAQWDKNGRDPNLLLRGQPLADALKFKGLGELEFAFVQASREDEEARERRRLAAQRRTRRLITAVVILSVFGGLASLSGLVVSTRKTRQISVQADSLTLALAALKANSDSLARVSDSLATLSAQQTRAAQDMRIQRDSARLERNAAASARDTASSLAIATAAAAAARENVGSSQEQSVLLALLGYSRSRTRAAQTALEEALRTWRAPQVLRGHREGSGVVGLSFRQDTRRLATAGTDSTVRIWDVPTGVVLHTLVGHTGEVWDVAFNSAGDRLASASRDSTARIWDPATGRELRVLRGHAGEVLAVNFSRDGRWLATAGDDGTARIWNAATGALVKTLRVTSGSVWDATFSPSGTYLAAGGQGGQVILWDTRTWNPVDTASGHKREILNIAFSNNDSLLATAAADSTVRIWTLPTSGTGRASRVRFVRQLTKQEGNIWDVAFNSTTTRIVTGGGDRTVRVFDVATGRELQQFLGHTWNIYDVAFIPGDSMVASASGDGTLRLWSLGEDRQGLTFETGQSWAAAYSPDGTRLAVGNTAGEISFWDASAHQRSLLRLRRGGNRWIRALSYRPDGRDLAAVSPDSLRVWRLDPARPDSLVLLWSRGSGRRDSANFWSVAYSPDNQLIAAGGGDSLIRIYTADSGRLVRTLSGSRGMVVGVEFDPRYPRILASTSQDWIVRLWNVEDGTVVDSLEGHSDAVWHARFSPDGNRLVTAGADAKSVVWDVSDPHHVVRRAALRGHSYWVWDAAFSRDSRWIATAGWDSTVRVWDASTGAQVRLITVAGTRPGAVAFDPRNRLAVTALDGTGRLYESATEDIAKLTALARRRLTRSLTAEECQDLLDRRTCPPSVETFLDSARTRAAVGDAAGARAAFDRALALEPAFGLTAELFLNPILAGYHITRATAAAREGEVEGPMRDFQAARKLLPALPLDPAVEPGRIAAQTLMIRARTLAAHGNLEAALMRVQEATSLDAGLAATNPAQDVRGRYAAWQEAMAQERRSDRARALVARSDTLARGGHPREAMAAATDAAGLDSAAVGAPAWNTVCWYGSLDRAAEIVLPACDRAVALDSVGYILDSRGLARALTGDIRGAIADFQVYVAELTSRDLAEREGPILVRRRAWLKALERALADGSSVNKLFSDQALQELRAE